MKSIIFSLLASLPGAALAITDEYSEAQYDVGIAAICVNYLGDMEMYDHYERKMIALNKQEFQQGIESAEDPERVKTILDITRPKPPAAEALPETVPENVMGWCDALREKMNN